MDKRCRTPVSGVLHPVPLQEEEPVAAKEKAGHKARLEVASQMDKRVIAIRWIRLSNSIES